MSASVFKRYAPSALLVGALFAACAYKNPDGIALVPLMAGCLYIHRRVRTKDQLAFTGPARPDTLPAPATQMPRDRIIRFYEISLMMLALSYCTTDSSPVQLLDLLALMVLGGALILHSYAPNAPWRIGAKLQQLLATWFVPLIHIAEPILDFISYLRARETNSAKKRSMVSVLIGIAIVIPLFAIIASLLADADLVFREFLDSLWRGFTVPKLVDNLIGLICYAMIAFWSAYCVWKILPGTYSPLSVKESAPRQFDALIGITITLPLTILYAVFCGIQLVYLVGRHSLPACYTYAQYAHEGFYQLCWVAIINLVLVSISKAKFKSSNMLRTLLLLISCCTYVMIGSALMRMILYVREYDLTFLRIFVLWFLLFLTILLTYLIVSILRPAFPLWKYGLITLTVMYLGFALLHPDYWIAHYNMNAPSADPTARYHRYHDTHYLLELSLDAVPAIAKDQDLLEEYYRQKEFYQDTPMLSDGSKKSQNILNRVRTFNVSEGIAQHYFRTVQ